MNISKSLKNIKNKNTSVIFFFQIENIKLKVQKLLVASD